MPSVVTNQKTEKTLRRLLKVEGYSLSRVRRNGETGVDVIAKGKGEEIFIEVIGHASSPPKRSRDFYESFFRAISRLKDGAKRCVIALPSISGQGLPQRAKHYGVAWKRIGQAFPELQIWLVDVTTKSYECTQWNKWAGGGK
jgi:hypothetical protein